MTGRGPRIRCGSAMAGVFDIDLETEEGSDGEEPELGAVSPHGTWGRRDLAGRRRGDGVGS